MHAYYKKTLDMFGMAYYHTSPTIFCNMQIYNFTKLYSIQQTLPYVQTAILPFYRLLIWLDNQFLQQFCIKSLNKKCRKKRLQDNNHNYQIIQRACDNVHTTAEIYHVVYSYVRNSKNLKISAVCKVFASHNATALKIQSQFLTSLSCLIILPRLPVHTM